MSNIMLSFFGAAGGVTGSCFELKADNRGIVVDLGMFQGSKTVEKMNDSPLGLIVSEIEGVVITHAHLDHTGRLPLLVKQGFRGKIIVTEPTKDLMELILLDAAKLLREEEE